MQNFSSKIWSGDYFWNFGLYWRLILKWVTKTEIWSMDWSQWPSVVNTVLNLRVIIQLGNFSISWVIISSSKRTLFRGGLEINCLDGIYMGLYLWSHSTVITYQMKLIDMLYCTKKLSLRGKNEGLMGIQGECDLYCMPTRFQCNSSARALSVLHEKYLNYSGRSELTTQKEFVEIRT
jgi:hypothetical protein